MSDRIACSVPFCGRTTKRRNGWVRWLCEDHWRMTSRHWRHRRALFLRKDRADLADNMFDRLERQAIERAVGITA